MNISIGYANTGVDERHRHRQTTEIYLVARGTAEMRIEGETIRLGPGDLVAVEPGEAHTFVNSSPDYFHFVIHTPGLQGEAARTDKVMVMGERQP